MKRFVAQCYLIAALFVLAMAVGAFIEQAHSLAFTIAVLVVVIGGAKAFHYLLTHH